MENYTEKINDIREVIDFLVGIDNELCDEVDILNEQLTQSKSDIESKQKEIDELKENNAELSEKLSNIEREIQKVLSTVIQNNEKIDSISGVIGKHSSSVNEKISCRFDVIDEKIGLLCKYLGIEQKPTQYEDKSVNPDSPDMTPYCESNDSKPDEEAEKPCDNKNVSSDGDIWN